MGCGALVGARQAASSQRSSCNWPAHPALPPARPQVLLNTFFGGSWVTPADTHIDFADFSVTVLG